MTTYYCIHGATNNGDGTTSAEAASAGAVGAFNDAFDCLDGTEAGLGAAPFIVNFKTNHSGSDITLTYTSDYNPAEGVGAVNRVTFIFDDGTIWPGEFGTFSMIFDAGTLLGSDGSSDGDVSPTTDFIAQIPDGLIIGLNYDTGNSLARFEFSEGVVANVYFKIIVPTRRAWMQIEANYKSNVSFSSIKIDVAEDIHSHYNNVFSQSSNSYQSTFSIDGLIFNFINVSINTNRGTLLDGMGGSGSIIKNLSFAGDTPVNPWEIQPPVEGLSMPFGMDLVLNANVTRIKYTGQSDTFGFKYLRNGVETSWSAGKNYPVYAALLPDQSTQWSIKVDTSTMIDGHTHPINELNQFFDQVSATKTLTMEVLIPDTFVNPQKFNWYAVFTYEQTDGNMVTLTTCGGGNLESSPVIWSGTTPPEYGDVTYTTYRFQVVTPTAIKQNSIISVTSYSNKKLVIANQFYFIDPEIGVS